jgi:hypothetical protein
MRFRSKRIGRESGDSSTRKGTTRCQSYADDETVIRTLYTGPASPYKTPPKKIATGETIYVEPIGAHPARARAVLEEAAYLKVMKYVDQEKYGYILTNAGVKLGDFWAMMKALSGEAGSNPDRCCLAIKSDINDQCLKMAKVLGGAARPVWGTGFHHRPQWDVGKSLCLCMPVSLQRPHRATCHTALVLGLGRWSRPWWSPRRAMVLI